MSIKDSYTKKITFGTWDGLEDKIDRLTVMMGKFSTRDNGINKQFKSQTYQRKRTVKKYDKHNYDRRNYQDKYRSNSGYRRIQFSGQNRGRPRYGQLQEWYRRRFFRGNMRTYQIFGGIIVEKDIEEIKGMKIITD